MDSNTPDPDPKIGMLLQERYRIIRKLGEGGMGSVYEAQHELIGRRLAIKCLHTQYLTDTNVVERFQREAQAATAVGNEHIIEVTDMGKFDDGSPFIVLEYLDGKELTSLLLEYGHLPVHRTIHIVLQVCDALASVHAKGIIHRDLKPENIFLIKKKRDQDFVKVLDFGISKMKESSEEVSSGLTKTGTTLGTPYYMSPEQAQGQRDVDQRADVYALGIILYQTLSGRLPFEADSYPMLMVKIMTETPTPLTEIRTEIPEGLARIVHRAISKQREHRFQSVDELAEALAPYASWDGVSLSGPPPSISHHPSPISYYPSVSETADGRGPMAWSQGVDSPTSIQPKRRTSLWLMLGISAVLVGAGITGAAVLIDGNRTEPESTAEVNTIKPKHPAGAMNQSTPSQQTGQQPLVLPSGLESPKQKEVRVKITAIPKDARIFIGGVEFPNPMDAYRPRSLDPIRIRVEREQYQTVEQLAIFDQNRILSFELKRGQGVKTLRTIRSQNLDKSKKVLANKQKNHKTDDVKEEKSASQTKAEQKKPVEKKPVAAETPKEERKETVQESQPEPKKDDIYRGPLGPIRGKF